MLNRHSGAADLCTLISGASITVSFATVVEIVQLVAGFIAVVTGTLSLYFHYKRFKAAFQPKKRRRRAK